MKTGERLKRAIRGRAKRTADLVHRYKVQRHAYEWRKRRTKALLSIYRQTGGARDLVAYRHSRALLAKSRTATMKLHDVAAASNRKLAAWRRKLKAFRASRNLNRTVAFDGTPIFQGLALMLADARRHGWGGSLQSADRRKGVPEKYGKRSQWWLYMAYWVWHLPGTNPANPPGRSTHELRSDAVAYAGPIGRPLSWWQLGFDVSDSETLRSVLVQLGYNARRPYSAGSEVHHLNLYTNPRRTLQRRGLV